MKSSNKKALFFIGLAILCHLSSIVFLLYFFPKKYILTFNKTRQLAIIVFGLLCSVLLNTSSMVAIMPFLPESYAWYIKGDLLGSGSLLTIISKYIFVPFYIAAIAKYPCLNLNKFNDLLFKWGVLAFTIRLSILNLSLINRMSMAFLLISLFPLYFYLVYLIQSKQRLAFNFITFSLFLIYAIKVIVFPTGEYSYQSIIFQ